MISCFLQKSLINRQRSKQNEYLIIYAYFLFDFGWIIKSVKILNYLFLTKFSCSEQYQSWQAQSNQNQQLQDDDLVFKDSNFYQNDLQKRNSILHFDYLLNIQAKYIIQCGKSQISQSLIGSSLEATQQSITQEYIETSLKSDIRIRYLEIKIVEVLILKQQLYNNLRNTSLQYQNDINFNKQLYQLCEQLYEVDKLLKQKFKNTPTQKIHSLYTFFQGEILCNYNKSIQFYKNSRGFEIESNKFQQILNYNMNQQNFHYVILELCDDMQNLTLKGQSQNFYDNYGLNNEKQRLFEHLLPDCLIPYHNLYVKQFFEKGTSKYFNIFRVNFIMNNQHLLTIVNMCHRVTDLFSNNNVTFAVFLQQATQDQAFLIIDGNNLKCTFTKNLLILLGWSEQQINQFCILKEFKQIEISQIYPNFAIILKQFQEKEKKQSSVNLYFPSPQSSFESLQREIKISNIKFKKIECDILIERKQIGNYCYYILNIIKMAEFNRGRQFSQIFQNPIKQNESINQSLYQDCIVDLQDDSPHIGNLNSVNFINQQQIGSIQNIQKPTQQQLNTIIQDNNSPVFNSRREETINQSEKLLMTQRNSQIKQPIISPSSQNEQSLQSNEDKEHSQRKTVRLELNENSIETDKMHKNNELLQQILSKSPSRYQQKFMYLFSIWFSLFIIFIIVQYIELRNDLDNFLSFGIMTSFYASIMGPHDLFFSMRITITAYQQMNREGFLPSSKLPQLIQPYQDSVQLGYTELRDSLYDQLNNQYIQSFLDEVNVTMYFMNKNDREIYGIDISFRDALFIILQYQYAQMIHLHYRISTVAMPYQISLFANYFMLHKESEKLTISMYDYAINMHQNLNQKLIALWVVFNFALIIIYIYLQIYQINFFQQLDKFIQLIFLIDEPILNNEIQRFNDLLDSIKNNSDILFMYNPENQLQLLLKKPLHFQKHQNQNYKQKQNYQSVNKKRNIIKILNSTFLIFLLSIILIFSLLNIISTTLFFNKYDDTLQLYQQIQEMKLRSGNLFLYREISLRWSNFTFLTEDNKLQLYDLIDKAQNAISNYIQLSNTINVDTYLIDQNLIDLFENLNLHTVCEQIDEKFKNLTSTYCSLSFDGSLSKGMITALSYISNLIKSQQAINNFTRRVEMQYYEQEGSQIVGRIFSVLVNQFNISLKGQFDDMKLYLTVLSISFIIITIGIQVLLFYYYSPYLGRIMKIIKRVIHLIPFESLMNNEMVERQLKELNFNFQ
ncbi:unnamed protein product [Paramecium pentaurelia]|uniref:Transmembrane protein n=1 Tax=Paramecium pentaurelia TaxID=43138 RepID=A0A8S1UQF6_9CILI|nr:unnamed protein product [Paramecium pentaurelia]